MPPRKSTPDHQKGAVQKNKKKREEIEIEDEEFEDDIIENNEEEDENNDHDNDNNNSDDNDNAIEEEEDVDDNNKESVDVFFNDDDYEQFANDEYMKQSKKSKKSNKKKQSKGEDDNDEEEEDDDEDVDIYSALPDDDDNDDNDDDDNDNKERYNDFFDEPDVNALKKAFKATKKEKSKKSKQSEDGDEGEDNNDDMDEDNNNDNNNDNNDMDINDMDDDFNSMFINFRETEAQRSEAREKAKIAEEELKRLSTFERQNLSIKSQIAELEKKLLEGRGWDQLGEISAKARPVDSLLNNSLDFEYATKQSEPVTAETSLSIEQIIKKRIREEKWDDPIRKIELAEKEYKSIEKVSDEQSKFGLAEIYEQQYLETKQELEGEAGNKKIDKLEIEHREIATMVGQLFYKLDSLSNYHFTPKPANLELSITPSNVSTINMEEIIPMGINDTSLKAPQEEYQSKKGPLPIARSEMSQEERQRYRKQKKEKRKKNLRKKAEERQAIEIQRNAGKIIPETDIEKEEAIRKKKGITEKELKSLKKNKNIQLNVGVGGGGGGDKYTNSQKFFKNLNPTNDKSSIDNNSSAAKPAKNFKL